MSHDHSMFFIIICLCICSCNGTGFEKLVDYLGPKKHCFFNRKFMVSSVGQLTVQRLKWRAPSTLVGCLASP